MGRFVDSIITHRILKLLTTPYEDTKAFKLGIIDKNGRELKKMKSLNSVVERDAYSILHRLVFRLKKIIERVPIEKKKVLSYAAALSLVKENFELQHEPIEVESLYFKKINENLNIEINIVKKYMNEKNTLTFKQYVDEDIPANNAGGGGIAGFTPDTIGVPKKAGIDYKKQNKLDANLLTKAIRTDSYGGQQGRYN